MHYAECGRGPDTVLCLHQTPRSWDEYRETLPRLGERYRAIAMDTPGMGFMWVTPLEKAATFVPPEIVERLTRHKGTQRQPVEE